MDDIFQKHLVSYSFGGAFGATYNSWNYDIHGDTSGKSDSFLGSGSCYYI